MEQKKTIRKVCAICQPNCVRVCPLSKYRSELRRHPKCPVCGAALSSRRAVCEQCGHIPSAPCPKCGNDMSVLAESCDHCGYRPPSKEAIRRHFYNMEDDHYKLERNVEAPPPGQPGGLGKLEQEG